MAYADDLSALVVTSPKQPPPLPLPVFILLAHLALACVMAIRPPTILRIFVSLLLISANIYGAVAYTVGKSEDDYALGSTVWGPTTLSVMLFTWLIPDPLRDIGYLNDAVPLVKKPIRTRIWYAVCLHYNWRFIGTNAQVANVPAPFMGTRVQYVARRLREIFVGLAVLDIAETFVHSHHHLYAPGERDTHSPAGVEAYLARSFCMAAWLVITYTVLKLSYCVLSCIAVATGLWRPADWPDVFGNVSDAYTVRRAWGRVWHQLLRRHFSRWGKLAARTLRAPRGSFLSSQAQVHGAFAASAVLHSIADLALGHGTRYLGNSAPFFLLNAGAITFEDSVIALARRAGVRGSMRATRVLGYVWVGVWFTWAVRFYQDPMYEAGIGRGPTLPYSPTREVVLPWIRRVTGL